MKLINSEEPKYVVLSSRISDIFCQIYVPALESTGLWLPCRASTRHTASGLARPAGRQAANPNADATATLPDPPKAAALNQHAGAQQFPGSYLAECRVPTSCAPSHHHQSKLQTSEAYTTCHVLTCSRACEPGRGVGSE